MWAGTKWYPNGQVLEVVPIQLSDDLINLVRALHLEGDSEEDGSLLEDLGGTLPERMRLSNEIGCEFVEWLQIYPPLNTVPSVAPFHSSSEMTAAHECLQSTFVDHTKALFSDSEYEILTNYTFCTASCSNLSAFFDMLTLFSLQDIHLHHRSPLT